MSRIVVRVYRDDGAVRDWLDYQIRHLKPIVSVIGTMRLTRDHYFLWDICGEVTVGKYPGDSVSVSTMLECRPYQQNEGVVDITFELGEKPWSSTADWTWEHVSSACDLVDEHKEDFLRQMGNVLTALVRRMLERWPCEIIEFYDEQGLVAQLRDLVTPETITQDVSPASVTEIATDSRQTDATREDNNSSNGFPVTAKPEAREGKQQSPELRTIDTVEKGVSVEPFPEMPPEPVVAELQQSPTSKQIPSWVPKGKAALQRWRRAYNEMVKMRDEYLNSFDKVSPCTPTQDEYRDRLIEKTKRPVSTKTIGRILEAGENGWIPAKGQK